MHHNRISHRRTRPAESGLARIARLTWLTTLASLVCGAALAAPRVPASDDEVVQTLRQTLVQRLSGSPSNPSTNSRGPTADAERAAIAATAAVRAQRARLKEEPHNLPLAVQTARAAISRARQAGDPRELGQAQAALAPWWAQSAPPPVVRWLRATIRQSQHDFPAALLDLDQLLQDPNAPLALQAQAELTRAAVLQVQGRLADAQAACTRLGGRRYAPLGAATQWPASVCLAELRSLQGQGAQAEHELQRLAREADPAHAGWLALVRAELAQRRGERSAGALYQAALRDSDDVYTLAAYADWLLAQDRAREVATLLASRGEADALLLRLALAQQRLGLPDAAASIALLQARFDATRLRGDTTHRREEARFMLDLRGEPAAALALAQANWQIQKEPADARLLADTARAAGQTALLQALLAQLDAQGWSDVGLRPAAAAARQAATTNPSGAQAPAIRRSRDAQRRA